MPALQFIAFKHQKEYDFGIITYCVNFMNIGKFLKRIFNPRPIDGYVSEIDEFLEKFDEEHAEEEYARKERIKHERIAHLRDNRIKKESDSTIWRDF